ncbi:MAG: hypothetical protein VZS44_10685 [Bacilli bacterium]|nr:hypothetical protein [Bacilli bacterium]
MEENMEIIDDFEEEIENKPVKSRTIILLISCFLIISTFIIVVLILTKKEDEFIIDNDSPIYITEQHAKNEYLYNNPHDFIVSGIVSDYFYIEEDVYVREIGENEYEFINAKTGETTTKSDVTISITNADEW